VERKRKSIGKVPRERMKEEVKHALLKHKTCGRRRRIRRKEHHDEEDSS
jgi:hypothetical protein